MTVTVLAEITINDSEPEALAEYFRVATPLLLRVGGKIVNRFEVHEAVIGKSSPHTVLVVEYPNREAVLEVFESAEYRSLIPARDRAFHDYRISICASEENSPEDMSGQNSENQQTETTP